MKRNLLAGFVLLLVGFGLSAAQADTGAHWHDIDNDFMRAFKNPMEGLEMGLDLRLRTVYAPNFMSLNNVDAKSNNHFQRYRTRWSTRWMLTEDVDFRTRLTWEFWNWCRPEAGSRSTDFDEAIFDHFNIQFRNAFDLPLTITAGRQDIVLGTGWLVLNGTPQDGSRTMFFDAIRGEYQLTDQTKVDLIYIQQYDQESKYIKPFNHRSRRGLTRGEDERGFIAYATNNLTEMTNLDAYYIYKRERQSQRGVAAVAKGDPIARGQDADINTFGARLYGDLDKNWSYSAEGAVQVGNTRQPGEASRNQRGMGTNNELRYSFHDKLSNQLRVGYEYLSGDSGHGTNTQFNPLWGDWPQFQRGGDLQSYIYTFEGKFIGNVINLHRLGIGHTFKPHEHWTLKSDYNLMWADRNTFDSATPGPLTFSDSGNFRGHMLSGLATYRCCRNFSTHFMLDYFIPGNYYASPTGDEAFFARVNMEWTF